MVFIVHFVFEVRFGRSNLYVAPYPSVSRLGNVDAFVASGCFNVNVHGASVYRAGYIARQKESIVETRIRSAAGPAAPSSDTDKNSCPTSPDPGPPSVLRKAVVKEGDVSGTSHLTGTLQCSCVKCADHVASIELAPENLFLSLALQLPAALVLSKRKTLERQHDVPTGLRSV